MKKVVHVISHSHWDREWYMPFESHHFRLIQLLDNILDLFKTDPEFKYYHLDGQTIVLDDYLAVRPERYNELMRVIQEGKLRVGPFYILQDEYLISSEANVRNGLIGHHESQRWDVPGEPIGYFPDTFGLARQTPQIVAGLELPQVGFARGVKPTGFNNQVADADPQQSVYSEMYWQSPNGSKILSFLFANWYSNANEIPTDPAEAKPYWDKRLADAERYSSSRHLLMLNGVDHEPVQKNLSEALRVANGLYDDYEFIHSNFSKYGQAVRDELSDDLSTIDGELRSQHTTGWYTLANTASTRIYLKQTGRRLTALLEQVIEPLAVMAAERGYMYPTEKIDYIWKLLLQNFPHDSICGCTVDAVPRENMQRYEKAETAARALLHDIKIQLAKGEHQRTADGGYRFHVVNTTQRAKTDMVTIDIELERASFEDRPAAEVYRGLAAKPFGDWEVVDENGELAEATVTDSGVRFYYELPDHSFRTAHLARTATVELVARDIPLFDDRTYILRRKAVDAAEPEQQSAHPLATAALENEHLSLTLDKSGAFTLYDKHSQREYQTQFVLEETGDIGNEYVFRESNRSRRYYSTEAAFSVEMRHQQANGTQMLVIAYDFTVPRSADEMLEQEQKQLIDITQRQAGRSRELTTERVTLTLSLTPWSRSIKATVSGDNQVKDHRFRILFPLEQESDDHLSDSIFDVLARPNHVGPDWENPTNPQTLQNSVAIYNEDGGERYGLTLATLGVPEYEVMPTNLIGDQPGTTLALTVLRSVGELGDWGYFPTPDAQCLGPWHATLTLTPWQGEDELAESLLDGRNAFIPLTAYTKNDRIDEPDAENPTYDWDSCFKQPLPAPVWVTAVKGPAKEEGHDYFVLRMVNVSDETIDLSPYLDAARVISACNLLEHDTPDPWQIIHAKEIKTLKVRYPR